MKTKTKVFLAILIGMLTIVCQEYVRRQFGINPQIWVFVAYVMVRAGGRLLLYAFDKELEEAQLLEKMLRKTENSAFNAFFNEDYSVEEERNKMKKVIKKVKKSRVHKELNFTMTTFLCFLMGYTVFFFEYFVPSPTWVIAEVWLAMEDFACAIIYTNKVKKISQIIFGTFALYIALLFF